MTPQPWLAPLGALVGGAAALKALGYRRGLLRQQRLRGPVISVGNLSAGGNGKTPLVAWIAELLRDEGIAVAILSRGYGGSFKGDALVVSDGEAVLAEAREAGDEPVMLARALPGVVIAVGPRRDVVGRAVEARFGERVHVLDDGFQHLRLFRNLDLVCLDPRDLGDRPLPAGRLREFPSALRRADLLLVTGNDPHPALAGERTLRMQRRLQGFYDTSGRPAATPARPFLVSGIARPERLRADVATLAHDVAGHLAFQDHHRFTETDLARAVAAAREAGADAIVTTAKDTERLPALPAQPPWLVLRISATVSDEPRLRALLLGVARRAA